MPELRVVRQTEYCVDFANEYGDFFVTAKWDGCCHIYRYYNGATFEDKRPDDPNSESDYIHICDLREFISFLTEVADKAERILGFEGYEARNE